MISIQKDVSILKLEELFESVDSSPSVLRLPAKFDCSGLGGILPAVMQSVCHWARTTTQATLKSYSSQPLSRAFEDLSNTPHGMVASYMAKSAEDGRGNIVDRKSRMTLIRENVIAMDSYDIRSTMKGPGAFLCCFSGAKNEYLAPLYISQQSLRQRIDFENLFEMILEKIGVNFSQTESLHAIYGLAYELFENTHDHARTDEIGTDYSWEYPNVRALLIRQIKSTAMREHRDHFFGDASGFLSTYKQILDEPSSKSAQFVELSVFDSGPGMISRWTHSQESSQTGHDLTAAEEKEIVSHLFMPGVTTKRLADGSGFGLRNVIDDLASLQAYLRIRTGRICLAQRFKPDSNEFRPLNWNKNRATLPPTTGTLFTIVIPVV